ncbi:positive regulator of sigma(E), RseC/MucC [Formivibrio citricus]|uniref:Positive regulator of sigma(E), RseC/MucC n=1 Tax=Formivibrio citricus TaxID=83765 RepID=A0A1I4WGK5_9NEIS|nr:SoxR reducing system RseC family protein [Formivibrio citricus]SFN12403.1 positive regulator of sigma(E), RseC/MucC [Formivibrio citricus]
MIESEVEVISVEDEYAWVRVKPHGSCGNCDPESGCKTVALTRLFGGAQEFRVRNPIDAQPGDLVLVSVDDGMLLKSALWGYGLPLALLMAGATLGHLFAPTRMANRIALLGAVVGALAAFMVLWIRRSKMVEPVIVEKRGPGQPTSSTCKNQSQ